MKFSCTALPTVGDFPEWVAFVGHGQNQSQNPSYLCTIDWENDSLIETLGGECDPAVDINDLLEMLGFESVQWLLTPLRIKDGCYLEGLNIIFPEGIRMRSLLPAISVNLKPCYAVDLASIIVKQREQIFKIYQEDRTPLIMWALLSQKNLAVIPCDVVEELTPPQPLPASEGGALA